MTGWISTAEAAHRLGISIGSVRLYLQDGRLHRSPVHRALICESCVEELRSIRAEILRMWHQLWFGKRACGWNEQGPIAPPMEKFPRSGLGRPKKQ